MKMQYLIFIKFQRDYLIKMTGYSKGHLSRIASGTQSPSEPFIAVCCHTLKEPAEELFRLIEPRAPRIVERQPNQDLIESIDELASRLNKAEGEIEKIKAELKQYS